MISLHVGDRLGDYSLLERIGSGASGEVWKALHVPSGATVALKAERIEGAAPGTSGPVLEHPNIVRVRERFPHDDLCITAMELVSGPSLRAVLDERGNLPLDEAMEIAAGVLAGLAHAHARGILHLDLKPGNILLENRTARICDFGSARPLPDPDRIHLSLDTDPEAKRIVGTAPYMAPEQRLGVGDVSPATDLYSFGVVLYETLTGRLPLGAFRYPSEMFPDIPASVDDVLRRCLHPDPARRPPSASAVSAALREAVDSGHRSVLQLAAGEITGTRGLAEYALRDRSRWEEVRRRLFDGGLEAWLRETRHFELARSAGSLRESATDHDAALQALLEATGHLEPPQLDLDLPSDSVDLGNVRRGEEAVATIRLIKRGRGFLSGEVRTSSPAIRVSPRTFRFDTVEIERSELAIRLRISTDDAPVGERRRERIEIGPRPVEIQWKIDPRPAGLELETSEVSVILQGRETASVRVVLRNPGDEPARPKGEAGIPWLQVHPPEEIPPGGEAAARIDVSGPAVQGFSPDDRFEAPIARGIVRFLAGPARASLRILVIRIPRFNLKLCLGGLFMGLVPVLAEALFLFQAAESGVLLFSKPRPGTPPDLRARRAVRIRDGISLLAGLLPGLLLHLFVISS